MTNDATVAYIIEKPRLGTEEHNRIIQKAKKLLDWKPETTFEQGIRKTIKWYVKNGKLWGYKKHGWKWRY